MTGACIGEPVSWLRLEQLALGELPPPAADAIGAHLAACAVCQACLDQIKDDRVELAALPATPAPLPPGQVAWWRRRWGWALGGGLAIAAAAIALFIGLRRIASGELEATGPAGSELLIGLKGGGEIAVGMVRERGGQTTLQPTGFRAGDRFKLIVTCGSAVDVWYDIAVFQPGADPRAPMTASYPMRDPARLTCGNRVALPGAFTITGAAPALVCLSLETSHPPSREPLGRRQGFGCYTLGAE